ncbi:DNA-binding protein [Halorubrum sp. Ib24]|uniref:helix-turn-helix domain-containing protein n=1 Tax=unclassified Halorubrum TaxID=2642239 RepID=UPI000B99AA29|nr:MULTISPECIES: helix-turn-helix domain-containing protein [unclassified Halorubrum]OYR42952.1 DNA-binding protein [Halorubrum sp. Ib24]OYR43541.1 DNA-binding protein [Halorubrum sp. Hd13]OYR44909.1 DNA-binding protein [Halorubrum sp. Ea8]OYR47276.1 DNA-binding protein [Halorubrum sp. Eb13]OYR55057.1 DNA-binding protein [Halorubrum sp. Ea1]
MSIIVTLHVEHERLALVPTLRRLDGADIEVVTQGTTDPGSSEFPFLVEYGDRDGLERALESDPTVGEYELIEWSDGTGVYYIEHTSETELISTAVSDANGFLIHTESERNGWLVRLLLPDRAALSDVWDHATENGMQLDIVEIHDNETTDSGPSYGLTDEQRQTLLIAYENGYFVEPREMSLDELADELGLSSTAVSGRLRRGMRNLVAATIATEGPEQ